MYRIMESVGCRWCKRQFGIGMWAVFYNDAFLRPQDPNMTISGIWEKLVPLWRISIDVNKNI